MSTFVTMSALTASRLLSAFWDGQFETRNAAENVVCAYGCGEPYEDFKAHSPECDFVKRWADLADVRGALGWTVDPTVRR